MKASVLLLLCPLSTGCHWLVGNPDAELNGGVRWHDEVCPPAVRTLGPRAWLRVRADDVPSSQVRVLASRVRDALVQQGWQVVPERGGASAWLDLDIRFWGNNPIRDFGVSTYDKTLAGMRADRRGPDEEVQPGRYGRVIPFFAPGAATLSRYFANVVEFDLIVDLHLRQKPALEAESTLVVWVRKIDLTEQEAAVAIADLLLGELRRVFPSDGAVADEGEPQP